MHLSTLNIILLAAVLAGWCALGWYAHLAARRRGRHQAEWAWTAAELSGLEGELDEVWETEAERIRRSR